MKMRVTQEWCRMVSTRTLRGQLTLARKHIDCATCRTARSLIRAELRRREGRGR